jgi:tetratricopeptide (TPR) repeat protein
MLVRIFCGTAVVVLLTGAAQAELSDLWKTCTGEADISWEQQIKSCTAIIESKKEEPERLAIAYNNRAVARLAMIGSTVLPDKNVMDDLGAAIRLNPKYADDYFNRGRAWHFAGVYHNAIDLYSAAIKLDPKHVEAYRHRALAWLFRHDPDQAIADYTEALKLQPGDADLYVDRARARDHKRDYDGMIADYTEALRLDANLVGAYSGRAHALFFKAEFDRAIADLDQAIRIEPDNSDHHANRGFAHFYRGDFASAAASLHRAIEMEIDNHRDFSSFRVLFRYLARTRAGQDGRAELDKARAETPGARATIALFLGRGSAEAALKVGTMHDRCEAPFYVGQWHLLRGEREQARRHLLEAGADDCWAHTYHYWGAVAELKRLGP